MTVVKSPHGRTPITTLARPSGKAGRAVLFSEETLGSPMRSPAHLPHGWETGASGKTGNEGNCPRDHGPVDADLFGGTLETSRTSWAGPSGSRHSNTTNPAGANARPLERLAQAIRLETHAPRAPAPGPTDRAARGTRDVDSKPDADAQILRPHSWDLGSSVPEM